jgi:drug/metabolite transporter (DMT)-like permease
LTPNSAAIAARSFSSSAASPKPLIMTLAPPSASARDRQSDAGGRAGDDRVFSLEHGQSCRVGPSPLEVACDDIAAQQLISVPSNEEEMDQVNSARPLDPLAAAAMVVLCASWGLNQVAIKLALPEIPPFTQGALRSCGALPVVLAIARLRGVPIVRSDGTLAAGLAAGTLFALEFIFIYPGVALTTVSRGVVFVYTAPFFIALGARAFLGETLGARQWSGLALAFIGIVVALGVPDPTVDSRTLAGDALMIAAAATWAATTLVIKGSALATASAEKTTVYQLAVSAVILGACAALFGEETDTLPGPVALGSLAYQAIWVVGITFTLWFALVVRYSASRLAAFTFLTPLFGIAAGHVVMGDPITPPFAIAVALVIAGLVLVNRR